MSGLEMLTQNQQAAKRGLLILGLIALFVIFLAGFCTIAAKAQPLPDTPTAAGLAQLSAGLTADQRALLVETFHEFAANQRWQIQYQAYLPNDIAFLNGKALAFEQAAYFLEHWQPGANYSPGPMSTLPASTR